MEENDNDAEKSIESVSNKIDKKMNEFQESINNMTKELNNNNIKTIKKRIYEEIKKSMKNIGDFVN